jgi:hypothetical protein
LPKETTLDFSTVLTLSPFALLPLPGCSIGLRKASKAVAELTQRCGLLFFLFLDTSRFLPFSLSNGGRKLLNRSSLPPSTASVQPVPCPSSSHQAPPFEPTLPYSTCSLHAKAPSSCCRRRGESARKNRAREKERDAPSSSHPEEQVVLRHAFAALRRLSSLDEVGLDDLGVKEVRQRVSEKQGKGKDKPPTSTRESRTKKLSSSR